MIASAGLRKFAIGLLGTTILVAGGQARAQTTADAKQALETIVVTAQKRSEDLQTVPFSIQALGGQTLQDHQVQSFDDYARLLPSVSFQSYGPGESQLFFRGIVSGKDGNPFGALPTAGVYLDETPVTTTGSLLDVHMYDIARVEALSGPQGTLFGASSLAGTLRVITNKPDPKRFAAGYDLQLDKYSAGGPGGQVEGFINLPITDHIAVRLVGFYQHDGGFIDNTLATRSYQRPHTVGAAVVNSPLTINNAPFVQNAFNDSTTFGGRIALGIELNDDWTITPQLVVQNQHTNGTFLYDPRAGDLKVHDFTTEYSNDKWYQASLTVNGKILNWDVLYAGGYMGRHNVAVQDYSYYTVAYDQIPDYNFFQKANGANIDPSQFDLRGNTYTKESHEFRVSSPSGERFQVTAGLFYERQTDHYRADFFIPGVSQSVQAPSFVVTGDDVFASDAHVVDRDYAIFAQADFKILPDLTLTAGIRGFKFRNSVAGFSGGPGTLKATGCTPTTFSSNCLSINKETKGEGETHKASLSWQVDDERMLYATYSTGFRPGGINRPVGFAPYSPDTLTNYEVGWKTSWLNETVRFNAAFYHEIWDGVQYLLPGPNGVGSFVNAGKAHINGVETNVDARFGNLTLGLAGAYNDARLATPFCNMVNGVPHCELGLAAPVGTRLPVDPLLKGTATARYDFDLESLPTYGQLSMVTQTGNSNLLTVSQNNALGNSPPFTTFDFAVGATLKNDMTVELFIQNMFDERGELSRNAQCILTTCLAAGRIYPTKPQFFGIKVGQRF